MCFVCSHIQTLDWGKDYITAYLLRYTTRRTLTILKCSPKKKWSEFSTVSLNSHTADVPIMKMFKVKFTFFKGEAIYYSSSCTSMAVIYTHFPPDMAYSVSSASRSQPINISIKLKVLIKKKTCCTDIIHGLSVKWLQGIRNYFCCVLAGSQRAIVLY